MDAQELRQLIAKPEWADVELKSSARAFPNEAASTLCAYANCGGGFLILGVNEKRLPEISGIDDEKLDDVQNQCLGLLKDIQKFSSPLVYDSPCLIPIDGKHVLVVEIQDSKRQNKPVKVKEKGSWVAYVRNGARDEVANDHELAQMLLDANATSVTGQLLELDIEQCFSATTIKWYRRVFESRHNQKYYELSDLEFLDELGLIRVDGDELRPTKAAILMFGNEKSINRILARYVVDAFWFSANHEDRSDVSRWQDRRPAEHESLNLFEAWRVLSDRYMYWAEHSFDIDESNLHRKNETPDYIGFREATVNLLVHQDFADHTRVPKIEFYKDICQYWNPGDSLVEQDQIASGQSKSRNPLVMQAFHRIGLSERAGSGIKEIFRSWLHLDRPEPVIENSRKEKTFQITLGKKPHISALQETIRKKVGVSLTDLQARIFVAVLNQPKTVEDMAEELSLAAAEIYPATDHLARQSLIQALPDGYQAMQHFADALGNVLLVDSDQMAESDQVDSGKVTKQAQKSDQALRPDLTNKQQSLLARLDGEMGLKQLMSVLGQTHRTHFKNNQLVPLLEAGLLAVKYPDNPNHPEQAYYLTELGRMVKRGLQS